jgi:hypothetical protein
VRATLAAIGSTLVIAAIGCLLAAIWVVGPDSARWAGTGCVLGTVGFLIGLASTYPDGT